MVCAPPARAAQSGAGPMRPERTRTVSRVTRGTGGGALRWVLPCRNQVGPGPVWACEACACGMKGCRQWGLEIHEGFPHLGATRDAAWVAAAVGGAP